MYGAGDGATTFNLPDMRDRFAEGAGGTYSVGTAVVAGLPNITGKLQYLIHTDTSAINNTQPESGAFRALSFQTTSLAAQTTTATRWSDPSFNAALSNSIYKEFSTVQPESLVLNYVIKY